MIHSPEKQNNTMKPESGKENGEEHPTWPVTFDGARNVKGLPPEVSVKNVILFMGSDGKWYAQNPSQELLDEIRMWRTDWMK